jgi:polyisoprenoid-binding protein YceI
LVQRLSALWQYNFEHSINNKNLIHMNTIQTQTKWGIDTTHTEVLFKVKHLVIATVTGSFKKFSGEVISESEDFNNAGVSFTIDVNSIDTNQTDRDGHLKSDDFFAAAQYPAITFTNGILKKVSGTDYKLTGDLTIRNTTKQVELDVEFGGTVVDPWGNTKAGFEIAGKINRKDFGLNWSAVTEAGGLVVSDEVKLILNVELARA